MSYYSEPDKILMSELYERRTNLKNEEYYIELDLVDANLRIKSKIKKYNELLKTMEGLNND